jgi:phosphomannomutase
MQKNRVLLVGSANMDFSMNVYKIPAVGETIIDDGGVAYTPGGKGGNAAVALAKLGADTTGSQFLDPDGNFPNHIPNPENKEAMRSVC